MNNQALTQDAGNRSVRSFFIGLSIDVGVALTLAITSAFSSANGWSDFQWVLLSFSVVKTILQSAGSFILRRFLDPSRFPTPVPPSDQSEPTTSDPLP